jgi:predicted transcriptional regulator
MENNMNPENTVEGMTNTENTETVETTPINETIEEIPFENTSVENTSIDVESSTEEALEVITPINEPTENESTEVVSEENVDIVQGETPNEESTENTEEIVEEEPLNIEEFAQNLNMKMDMVTASLNMMNQNLLVHTNAYDQALQKEINDRTVQWNTLSNNMEVLINSLKDFPENCKKHFEFIGGLTILNIIILLINILL